MTSTQEKKKKRKRLDGPLVNKETSEIYARPERGLNISGVDIPLLHPYLSHMLVGRGPWQQDASAPNNRT